MTAKDLINYIKEQIKRHEDKQRESTRYKFCISNNHPIMNFHLDLDTSMYSMFDIICSDAKNTNFFKECSRKGFITYYIFNFSNQFNNHTRNKKVSSIFYNKKDIIKLIKDDFIVE